MSRRTHRWTNLWCGALALAGLATRAAPVRADLLSQLELRAAAGAMRLDGSQDLGDYAQLYNLRRGVLDTALAVVGLRALFSPLSWLSAALAVDFDAGPVASAPAFALGYRAELLVRLPLPWVQPFVGPSAGGLTLISGEKVLGNDTDPVFGWVGGVEVTVDGARRYRLVAAVRHLMSDAQQTGSLAHTWTVTVGVGVRLRAPGQPPPPPPPPVDRDGDAVLDRTDRCPDQAEDADGYQDDDGCPDRDDDGDSIEDVLDRCPRQPGPQPDGCPPAPPQRRRKAEPPGRIR